MLLIFLFAVIVFSPCVLAFVGGADSGLGWFGERNEGGVGVVVAEIAEVQRGVLEEVALADAFRVQSFPKGLGQRRLLLQDRVGEVRLHIGMLRRAVREQMQRAGVAMEGFARAAKLRAESRAVLLRRLADEARAAWERTEAVRMRQARLAAERSAGWSDEEDYARWRWREQNDGAFQAA